MGLTFSKRLFISLHFAKKPHENRSGESREIFEKSTNFLHSNEF